MFITENCSSAVFVYINYRFDLMVIKRPKACGPHFLMVKCAEGKEMSLLDYQRLPHIDSGASSSLTLKKGKLRAASSLDPKAGAQSHSCRREMASFHTKGFLAGLEMELT